MTTHDFKNLYMKESKVRAEENEGNRGEFVVFNNRRTVYKLIMFKLLLKWL